MSTRSTSPLGVAAIALAVMGSGACSGTTTAQGTLVYDHQATYVETLPPHTIYQPRVYYRGRYAYLVDNRWYYPSDRGWVVFRDEPRELARYRMNYLDTRRHEFQYRSSPEYRYRRNAPEYRYRSSEYGTRSLDIGAKKPED